MPSPSSTITTDTDLLHNPHPGEVLRLEFMEPLGLSQNALARALHVPPRRINELVHAAVRSPPTPTSASPATSASRRASSWAFRRTTSSWSDGGR